MNLLPPACDLAERGLCVFRLAPTTKVPYRQSRAHNDATTDLETIEDWWSRTPNANIGIACGMSNLAGMDVDPRRGGWEDLKELARLAPVPVTPAAETARRGEEKGVHLYFPLPGAPLVGKLGGIDIKVNGYLVAPPSQVKVEDEGLAYVGSYEWLDDLDTAMSPIPEPWMELLTYPTTVYGAAQPYCGRVSEKNWNWDLNLPAGMEVEKDWLSPRFLSSQHLTYMREQPKKRDLLDWNKDGVTRSEIEASIVCRWVYHGASDRQISDLAQTYLPKAIESGDHYIRRTIGNERRWYFIERNVVTSPDGGVQRRRDAKPQVNDDDYLELVNGQRVAEWVNETGLSCSTAYKLKDRLVRDGKALVHEGRIMRP